jgi:hypothetical protein
MGSPFENCVKILREIYHFALLTPEEKQQLTNDLFKLISKWIPGPITCGPTKEKHEQ